jgi:ribosomal protein S24E
MNVDITETTPNPLLKRKEISFEAREFKGTPSRKELKEHIVKNAHVKEDLIVIGRLVQGFGKKTLTGTAHVYEDLTTLKKFEREFMIVRTNGKQEKVEEKKAEEAPAEGAEEKPAEEKKEE